MAIVTTLIEASGHTMNTTALFSLQETEKHHACNLHNAFLLSTSHCGMNENLWMFFTKLCLHPTQNVSCTFCRCYEVDSHHSPLCPELWRKTRSCWPEKDKSQTHCFSSHPHKWVQVLASLLAEKKNVLFPDNILLPSNCKRKAVYFTQCRHGTLVASSPWGWMQTLG